jgi:hypothetical protein
MTTQIDFDNQLPRCFARVLLKGETSIGKRDNAIQSIQELFEEFETVLTVEPNLDRLETIFNLVVS